MFKRLKDNDEYEFLIEVSSKLTGHVEFDYHVLENTITDIIATDITEDEKTHLVREPGIIRMFGIVSTLDDKNKACILIHKDYETSSIINISLPNRIT